MPITTRKPEPLLHEQIAARRTLMETKLAEWRSAGNDGFPPHYKALETGLRVLEARLEVTLKALKNVTRGVPPDTRDDLVEMVWAAETQGVDMLAVHGQWDVFGLDGDAEQVVEGENGSEVVRQGFVARYTRAELETALSVFGKIRDILRDPTAPTSNVIFPNRKEDGSGE